MKHVLICVVTILGIGCCVDVPQEERLGVLEGARTEFTLDVKYGPPYRFVLGVPRAASTSDAAPPFTGTLTLHRGTKEVMSLAIDGASSQPCNWLHMAPELDGYILAWRDPAETFPQENVERGLRYRVTVSFSTPPPSGSSLWFSSIANGVTDEQPKNGA